MVMVVVVITKGVLPISKCGLVSCTLPCPLHHLLTLPYLVLCTKDAGMLLLHTHTHSQAPSHLMKSAACVLKA